MHVTLPSFRHQLFPHLPGNQRIRGAATCQSWALWQSNPCLHLHSRSLLRLSKTWAKLAGRPKDRTGTVPVESSEWDHLQRIWGFVQETSSDAVQGRSCRFAVPQRLSGRPYQEQGEIAKSNATVVHSSLRQLWEVLHSCVIRAKGKTGDKQRISGYDCQLSHCSSITIRPHSQDSWEIWTYRP